MRRRRSTAFQPRIGTNRTGRHEAYVAILRLGLLIALALLLVRALQLFLSGIFPFAPDSPMIYLLPGAIGVAILGTLVGAVRIGLRIKRDLKR